MTTDLDGLCTAVDGSRMAATVTGLAADRSDPATLVAVCRFVVASAWLATTSAASAGTSVTATGGAMSASSNGAATSSNELTCNDRSLS